MIRASLEGLWYDEKNIAYEICHNRLTGRITVIHDGKHEFDGNVVDNAVIIEKMDKYGLWDYAGTVFMLDGSILRKVN
jgi:hypothetical protein